MMAVIKVLPKSINLQGWTIVSGFQGTGLVGVLAAQYMAKKLGAEQIGYIESNKLPPVAILSEGEIKHPIRIFSSVRNKLIIVESELPIPKDLVFEIAEELNKWAAKNKAKEIICVEGISVEEAGPHPKTFVVVSQPSLEKKAVKTTELLKNGLIVGVAAAMLLESKDIGMPNTCYLAESHANFPDGRAAAAIIDKLNVVLNLKIDTKPLVEEATKFESKLKELIKKAQYLQQPNGASAEKDEKRMYG